MGLPEIASRHRPREPDRILSTREASHTISIQQLFGVAHDMVAAWSFDTPSGIDDAGAIHREKCNVNATLGERLARIQRGAVLNLRGDDVTARGGFTASDAKNCEIVRFRAAAGECDFGGLRTD